MKTMWICIEGDRTMRKVILAVAAIAVILAGATNAKAWSDKTCEGSASYDTYEIDRNWQDLQERIYQLDKYKKGTAEAERLRKQRLQSKLNFVERINKFRKGKADFSKKLIEATKKKVGGYEVYITSIAYLPYPSSEADRLAINIEIKNASQTKMLESARALTTTSCSGEGELTNCFTFPMWSLKDSFGNNFKSSSAGWSSHEQIAPDECDSTGASYSVKPIKNSSIIVKLPKRALGTALTLTIPKELINEQFYSN